MPLLKDSVFTIWNAIKKSALGISDGSSTGIEGFYASFLPTGLPVDKDDFYQPFSYGQARQPDSLERLRKVSDLVDQQLAFNKEGTSLTTGSTISEAYRLIVNGAFSLGLPPLTDATLKEQIGEAKKLLYTDISHSSDKTPLYKNYRDLEGKWQDAIIGYAGAFQNMKTNPAMEESWPQLGLIYDQKISDALSDLEAVQNDVLNAEALIGSQAIDTAGDFIRNAKEDVDRSTGRYLVNVGEGAGGIKILYSEIIPSNWCDPDADNWSNYTFDNATSHYAESNETVSFGGGGGVGFGFWSIGGSGHHQESRQEINSETDSLTISFEYTMVDIRRPWLDTLLFKLNNWFLQGQKPGIISDGTTDQLTKTFDQQGSMWFPSLPVKLILVKNLFISTAEFQKAYDASQSYTSAGASFGWGPFSINGSYSKSSSNVVIDTVDGKVGLRVKGIQIIGHISEVISYSPKIEQPSS
jgi:hypothetical protein